MSQPSSGDDPLLQLAEEFAARFRRGERPSLTEYTDKHPELAKEIRDLFPAMVVMEEFGSVAGAPAGPEGAPAVDSCKVPQQLGEYRILREVGRGGMGIVYEAVQESLGRHVALKVLPFHSLLNPTHLERFRREARAAAQLHHTNIVPVFGIGEHEGTHYYAMQFIQGQGLDDVLKEVRRLRDLKEALAAGAAEPVRELTVTLAQGLVTGQFAGQESPVLGTRDSGLGKENVESPVAIPEPPVPSPDVRDPHSELAGQSEAQYFRSVARLGVQVAEALGYAHKQKILHRDIKPSNLLLDTQGTVWISDFGLAKAEDSDDLTHTGDIVGTLRYMAPERFQGEADPRSDVYSLGATLYELLTLQPAFEDSNRVRLIERVTHEEPPQPRKVDPHVPRDLETIILKALAKEPERRYQTAAALAEDLRRFLGDRTILARRSSWRERTWRWCRRNPAVAALLGLVIVVFLTGSIFSSYFAFQAEERAQEADKNAKVANDNAEEAKWQTGIAQRNEQSAKTNEATAKANELVARRRFYAAQMNLAYQAWEAGQPARVLELLEGQRPKFGQEDLRSFEWYYLWRLCQSGCRLWLRGHTGWVYSVAFSPDGKTLASGSADGSVRLWDVVAGQERASLGQGDFSGGLAISPDGKMLASLNNEGVVNLWDVAARQKQASLKGDQNALRSVAFSPDGKALAAGSEAGTVGLWDVARRKKRATLRGHTGPVLSVAFSPDSKTLATASGWGEGGRREGGLVRLWDLTAEPVRSRLQLPGADVVAFSPDSKSLAAGGSVEGRAVLKLYDLSAAKERTNFQGHIGGVSSVAFTADGSTLASAANDRTVRLWDVATGQERRCLAHLGPVLTLAICPDGRTLASGAEEWAVRLWDLEKRPDQATLQHDLGDVNFVAFPPDGKRLISGGSQVRLWDVVTERVLATFPIPHGPLAVSPDGKMLASWDGGPAVKLWDLATGQMRASIPGKLGSSWGGALAFSPDAKTLAMDSHDGTVRLWDVATQRIRATLANPRNSQVASVAFSSDGKHLAAAGQFGWVQLWDATTGQPRATLLAGEGAGSWANAVGFSPDGKTLASGNHRGTVRLWDVDSRQLRASLKGHTDQVMSVVFFPDGKTLATGSHDTTIKLWDVATGQERVTLKGHKDSCWLAIAPDGNLIASGSSDGTVKLWRAASDEEATALKTDLDPDDPDSPVAQNNLGDQLRAAGWSKEAEAAYRQAMARLEKLVAAFPSVPAYRQELARSHVNLAQTYGQEEWEKALAEFSQLLALKPDAWEAWSGRAFVHFSRQQWERAISDFSKAIDLAPQVHTNWWHRGHAYLQLAQWDKAAADFGKVVEQWPDGSEGWYLRAVALAQLNQPDKALADLRQAIAKGFNNVEQMKNDPKLAPLRTREDFGKLLEKAYRNAVDVYSKLVLEAPGDSGYRERLARSHLELAEVLRAQKRPGDAAEHAREAMGLWEKLAADFPLGENYRVEAGHTLWQMGHQAAEAGRQKEAENHYRRARAVFEKLAAEFPQNRFYRQEQGFSDWNLAALLRNQNRLSDAEKSYRDAVDVYSKLVTEAPADGGYRDRLARSHLELAEVLRAEKRPGDAAEHAREAMGLWEKLAAEFPKERSYHERQIVSHFNLADLLTQAGRIQEAERHFAKILELNPRDSVACNNLAWFLATWPETKLRDPARAVVLAKKAVELEPKQGMWWNTLGAAQYRAGNWNAAIAALEKSMEFRQGGDSFDWFFLSMAHWKLNQKDQARKWYDQAVQWMDKNAPKDEELIRFRAEAKEHLGIGKKKD